jgi:hypothetical protein
MNNNQTRQPSAYPMTENPDDTVRIPTHQAPLADNERTIIEGLGLSTNPRQTTRHSRRHT